MNKDEAVVDENYRFYSDQPELETKIETHLRNQN